MTFRSGCSAIPEIILTVNITIITFIKSKLQKNQRNMKSAIRRLRERPREREREQHYVLMSLNPLIILKRSSCSRYVFVFILLVFFWAEKKIIRFLKIIYETSIVCHIYSICGERDYHFEWRGNDIFIDKQKKNEWTRNDRT